MDEEAMNEANEAAFNDAFDRDDNPAQETVPEQATLESETDEAKSEPDSSEESRVDGAEKPKEDENNPPEDGEDNDYSDLFGTDADEKNNPPEDSGAPETKKKPPEEQSDPVGLSYDDIFSELPQEYNGTNVREFAEMYPEEAKAAAAVAEIVARKMLGERPAEPSSDVSKRLEQLEQVIRQTSVNQAQENYNRAVLEKHPDAREIVSRDAKFKEWLKGQSSGIKKLFLESSDPKDACMILDMYKGTSRNGIPPAKRSAYAGSGRGGSRPNPSGRTPEDEFNEGWEADK